MEKVTAILSISVIIVGIVLLVTFANLIRIINNNRDERLENVADKINKNTAAAAVLLIVESALNITFAFCMRLR